MSDSEEENFCFFGKPLEPYAEDAFPKKKPISIEDQIATDAQGRRRFHGAFTGGFSAGFFNTVGSLEGWTPSEFKSTRQDKAPSRNQKPEDFMDDEDLGEFGIAPQTVKATRDYNTVKKRKRHVFTDGPIPGEPVLHTILSNNNDTIGYLLLKNMSIKDKKQSSSSALKSSENNKTYGCEMPKTYEISIHDNFKQYPLDDIYKEYLSKPKDNSFGLGYSGLEKREQNLFKSANLVLKGRNDKKLTVTGQAFGVGAFEDDDDDIYVKDDMSKYDFELTSEKAAAAPQKPNSGELVFDEFVVAKKPFTPRDIFPPPTIPHSFTGKHKVRRSRFEPIPEPEITPQRGQINPEIRARYLGEESSQISTTTEPEVAPIKTDKEEDTTKNKFDISSFSSSSNLVFDRFVSASQSDDTETVVKPSETLHGTAEMRDAARMEMFGPLTHTTFSWQPCSLLCRRFNVPEPNFDIVDSSKNKKRTKNLIFEYEKFSDVSCDFKPGLSTKNINETNSNEEAEQTSNKTEENVNNDTATSCNDELQNQESERDTSTPVKDITDKLDVDKNIDLFKAVFLSSSESEDEDEATDDKSKETQKVDMEMKANILSDNLLSNIKPIKEGILSNMDFSVFNKETSSSDVIENSSKQVATDDSNQIYGPKLPERILNSTSEVPSGSVFKKRENIVEDSWIEASKIKKKHKKHKTKHKKKHKHKKS